MKRLVIGMAIVAIIGIALIADAYANGVITKEAKNAKEKIWKFMHRWHRRNKQLWHNLLNLTRMEGTLEYENGSYYLNGIKLYMGGDYFLNSWARSDYDRDGQYEYVWQELNGLIGKEIVVNGILKNNTLYVSHINGIWLRMPKEMPNMVKIEGILEFNNGSFFVNDTMLIIKHGFSKSDIDGDGSLERMFSELYGLIGEEITIDGFLNDRGLVVVHINGIWAR